MSPKVADSECASGKPCIAVSLADPAAHRRVSSLLQSQGSEILELSSAELARWDCGAAWQALVYDLCPWDESAVETARHIRQVILGPILLYVPHVPGVGHILESWARDPRVMIMLQFEGPQEAVRLGVELNRLRLRIPCEQVAVLIHAGLPEMSTRVSCYVRTTLRDLASVSIPHLPKTSAIAEEMDVSVRTMERTLHAEGLPNPKEFLNWITLLYATLAAELGGVSLGAVARSRGWYPSDVYRLRHRLMDRSGPSEQSEPRGDFERSLLAFLKRCGVPKQRAHEVLAKAS